MVGPILVLGFGRHNTKLPVFPLTECLSLLLLQPLRPFDQSHLMGKNVKKDKKLKKQLYCIFLLWFVWIYLCLSLFETVFKNIIFANENL
jgi:hypothetical protein